MNYHNIFHTGETNIKRDVHVKKIRVKTSHNIDFREKHGICKLLKSTDQEENNLLFGTLYEIVEAIAPEKCNIVRIRPCLLLSILNSLQRYNIDLV